MSEPNITQSQPSPEPSSEPISEVSKDIDAVFGPGGDDGDKGGKQPASGDPFASKDNQDTFSQMQGNPEELAKMFQSKYDKTKAELDKTSQRLATLESVESFVNSVYDDPEIRRAFIAELEPALVKPKDPYEALEEQLRNEFGVDFVPDDEEAKKPFTKTWKYYKRADSLEKELLAKSVSQAPQSLKAIREERKRKVSEEKLRAAEEKKKVLSTMKWDDQQFDGFAGWVGKLSATDLAKIYTYAMSRRGQNTPNLVNQSGGNAPTSSQMMDELDKIFGKG